MYTGTAGSGVRVIILYMSEIQGFTNSTQLQGHIFKIRMIIKYT